MDIKDQHLSAGSQILPKHSAINLIPPRPGFTSSHIYVIDKGTKQAAYPTNPENMLHRRDYKSIFIIITLLQFNFSQDDSNTRFRFTHGSNTEDLSAEAWAMAAPSGHRASPLPSIATKRHTGPWPKQALSPAFCRAQASIRTLRPPIYKRLAQPAVNA
ncbi:hypothetical protein [Comamonas sp. B-9]|uniref:hypothetical protein n=1 Tax=Comamonas sp. B-9 TaxID=1055192 RepID=UPI0011DE035B|nr:hypothetical protein [Comamonas sp. B-9]